MDERLHVQPYVFVLQRLDGLRMNNAGAIESQFDGFGIADVRNLDRFLESFRVGIEQTVDILKASMMGFKLYYWRDAQDEVDFVLVRGESVIGIEVKSGRRTMNRGLSVFMESFHPKYVYVVGSGGISIEDFLKLDLNVLFG